MFRMLISNSNPKFNRKRPSGNINNAATSEYPISKSDSIPSKVGMIKPKKRNPRELMYPPNTRNRFRSLI